MFTCFQANIASAGAGSAIFGSLIPKTKVFVSSVNMPSQDSLEQQMPQFMHTFVSAYAAVPMVQFIGTF